MSRLDEVLENARAMRYSDVHIDSKGQVLVRNNGILEHYPVQFSGQETNAMLQDLCANRDLSLLEQRRDLDFVYVENSEGAHNSSLAKNCLDKSEKLVDEAMGLFEA